MFTSQKSSTKALLQVLAVLSVLSTKELTALSIETTAASVVTNTSLSLNNSSVSVVTEGMTYKPCGKDMDSFCVNGGQCVYYQDQETPSCRCKSPFEGPRCMTMVFHSVKCYSSQTVMIGIIVGSTMVVFLLLLVILCCVWKGCVKSAPLKASAPKIQV